ncbi:Pyruvate dehydrogenase complex repressor [Alloiococcus otitis]|uniref:HTH gntR-type domain-containing protein n=1 Tax=Alloiococcus otitis ATCC 51267 TaxID=883081 RepID=K9EB93_9LACT|nr:FadR/GntR family transcriptional regulator [Alloiococcus otitis]EKU93903.1 hypothetical protein HMPREF9698_00580 [Alloiococcus otitis ATCC 51267]SUU81715.1 Pyruvate dehydrogenase complex repressor [Alloiococcus otitis]
MTKNTKSLVDQTADKILAYMADRKLTVGDKIPNEYDLAKDLEVSRSTIREAVRVLTSKNILEIRRGLGTFVSSKRGISEDPLGFSLVPDTLKLVQDLFEVRSLLEPRMTQLAAVHASQDEVAQLKEIKEKIEDQVETSGQLHFQYDMDFHSLIAQASGNLAMTQLIPIINQSIWLYNTQSYSSEAIKREMVISHQEILEAIQDQKPDQAYQAMANHIQKVRESLVDLG